MLISDLILAVNYITVSVNYITVSVHGNIRNNSELKRLKKV